MFCLKNLSHMHSLVGKAQIFRTRCLFNTISRSNLQLEALDMSEKVSDEVNKWRKAKKVAVMLSFVGKGYLGMQRNPGYKTIEEDLLTAFRDGGFICQEWFENLQKCHFQRASRTDKGVSASKMVVSLKMVYEDKETAIDALNSHLPATIRVHDIKRVTKNFNCKNACDGRTYLYFLPTFAFAPVDDAENPLTNAAYRMSEKNLADVNEVLAKFVGSRYFHNYTSGKLPLEPSSQRYITEFSCGAPFERDGMEFAVIRITGQSFMIHQIRKMIGMAISVVRGHASPAVVDETWKTMRIDVPRAPGLGLMLDEVHYDRYNQRFGKDGCHETLSWENVADHVEAFKNDFIFPEMADGEKNDNSMFEWLKVLPMHTFSPRHFENSRPELSPLTKAALNVENGEKIAGNGDVDE